VRGIAVDNVRQKCEHASQICQYIVVPEAHDRKSLAVKPIIARKVRCSPGMLAAIDLDHDTLLEGKKIGDIPAKRNLAAKLCCGEATIAEYVPELPLCIGHLAAKRSCS
jgi:hypothetical protein